MLRLSALCSTLFWVGIVDEKIWIIHVKNDTFSKLGSGFLEVVETWGRELRDTRELRVHEESVIIVESDLVARAVLGVVREEVAEFEVFEVDGGVGEEEVEFCDGVGEGELRGGVGGGSSGEVDVAGTEGLEEGLAGWVYKR